jgi:hypothetical protein
MKTTKKDVISYIKRIKNSEKRRYAQAYYDYCEGITDKDPDYLTFDCGAMAKQSVRFELREHGICQENRSDYMEVTENE